VIWEELFAIADAGDALMAARRNPSPRAAGLPDEAEIEARREALAGELAAAEERLSETRPTTLPGCIAALGALAVEADDLQLGSCDWHAAVIQNVVETLRELRTSLDRNSVLASRDTLRPAPLA
jgi:hypothetical protein